MYFILQVQRRRDSLQPDGNSQRQENAVQKTNPSTPKTSGRKRNGDRHPTSRDLQTPSSDRRRREQGATISNRKHQTQTQLSAVDRRDPQDPGQGRKTHAALREGQGTDVEEEKS